MSTELNKKCKCGHKKEFHAPSNLSMNKKDWDKDEYGGECCVQYRKDENMKSCYCWKFKEASA